ncbi:MAG: hypothetical protein JXA03_00750 [Bacteroidales bacterium]|nr:hypothetical protein [Bacteroidales bacterium]
MKIIDIAPENEHLYFCCLEDWSEEMKEAGDHKQRWYELMKAKGLRVKFAVDDKDVIGGMIQYLPVEHSIISGKDLFVVLCIWVHGYRQGRGNFRKMGMGKALLKAAEEDCEKSGAGGLVTWGLSIPVFMRASWFKKHGYKVVDKQGIMRLMWKRFRDDVQPPEFIKRKKKPSKGEGKVALTIFRNGWCPAMNLVYERAKRAAAEFDGKVEIREFETTDPAIVEEWGITDGLFINGKGIRTGPPPSYQKLKRKIGRKVRRG